MAATILRQQNDNRFLIDAGTQDGIQMGRIYDVVGDTYGQPMPVGTITSMSLGWGPVVAPEAIIEFVTKRVSGRY